MLDHRQLPSCTASSLRWRHNGHDGVSNHQPHGCLLSRLFRRKSKKTSKLRVTGLCVGNSPGPVNSPHKGPVTRKMSPFDYVIMIESKPNEKARCSNLQVPFPQRAYNYWGWLLGRAASLPLHGVFNWKGSEPVVTWGVYLKVLWVRNYMGCFCEGTHTHSEFAITWDVYCEWFAVNLQKFSSKNILTITYSSLVSQEAR